MPKVVRAHGQGPVAARLVAGRGIHHPGVAIGLVAQRGGRIAHREFAVAGGGQAQFPVVRTPGAAQDRLVARVAVLDAADFIAADQRLGQAQRTEYRRGAADATHFAGHEVDTAGARIQAVGEVRERGHLRQAEAGQQRAAGGVGGNAGRQRDAVIDVDLVRVDGDVQAVDRLQHQAQAPRWWSGRCRARRTRRW
ncbi:hypothetical protein G6F22_016295 [Rhizopus arrhizus]|nr:hypothetical protein G6F22_016295 [Rhizopus arrhizus]